MSILPAIMSVSHPNRFRSAAATDIRSRARPARRMGDPRWQVSWLAARTPAPAFPKRFGRMAWRISGNLGPARRLQLRGQPGH